jgi:hypothetical protein
MTTKQFIITRLRLLALLIVAQSAQLAIPVAIVHILRGRDDRAWAIIRAQDRLGNAGLSGNDAEMLSYRARLGKQAGRRRWCITRGIATAPRRKNPRNSDTPKRANPLGSACLFPDTNAKNGNENRTPRHGPAARARRRR